MNANIDGEDEKYVKVYITDNAGVEHELTISKKTGKIAYHDQTGYADTPAGRTPEETEHGNQARRYAKWCVYRECGYGMLPRCQNPDAIVGAMLAVGATPATVVEEYFGDLLEQLRTHEAGRTDELQVGSIDSDDILAYRQDIYVEPDPLSEDQPLADAFAEYFSDPTQTVEHVFDHAGPSIDDVMELVRGEADPEKSLPQFEIEAVSDLHYLDAETISDERTTAEGPRNREPDASLELLPLDPDVFDSPRELLFTHLGNQVRDYYLLMGCEPPSVFQQQGLGTFEGTRKQQMYDLYEQYYLAKTPVSSWKPV